MKCILILESKLISHNFGKLYQEPVPTLHTLSMTEIGTTDYRSVQVILLVNNSDDTKRRIAEELGKDLTIKLYRAFVQDILDTLDSSDLRYAISLYPENSDIYEWLDRDVSVYAQRGSTPVERVKNTFLDAFSRGERKVMVLVSDIPDIPPEEIMEAIYSFKDSDVVIGPSVDGGYNLIGFSDESFRESAFDNISWGTDMAFADTAEKLGGMKIYLLSPWPDIDTIANLRSLLRDKRNPKFQSSHTMEVLSETSLINKFSCGI